MNDGNKTTVVDRASWMAQGLIISLDWWILIINRFIDGLLIYESVPEAKMCLCIYCNRDIAEGNWRESSASKGSLGVDRALRRG